MASALLRDAACESGGATGLMVIMALFASAAGGSAAELKPETFAAFDKYIRLKEARLEQPPAGGSFLWADAVPDRNRQLRDGAVLCQPASDQREVKVPDGLIHDWIGAVFIPGTTVEKTIALVQDYSNHRNVYQPEVIDSKVLTHSGDDFKVYLRLKKKKVMTVVLNTEHDVHYIHLDRDRWQSRSYSTHIGEVENAGEPDERELPAGKDHGFLWRLHSYWRFQERDGGVYVECEAVSLTRNVPAGLGWLIEPIIRKLPRESLVNTLLAMRAFFAPNHAIGGPRALALQAQGGHTKAESCYRRSPTIQQEANAREHSDVPTP